MYSGSSLSSVISKLIFSSWAMRSSSKEEKLLAIEKSISKSCSIYTGSRVDKTFSADQLGFTVSHYNYHTFAVDNPGLEELWNVEDNAEDEDREEVEADSLADRAGLRDVPVGVRMADSAVPSGTSYRSPAIIRLINFIHFMTDCFY